MSDDTLALLRSLRHPDADRVDEVFPAALRDELLGSILATDAGAARCASAASSGTPPDGSAVARPPRRARRWRPSALAIGGVAALALAVGLVGLVGFVGFGTGGSGIGGPGSPRSRSTPASAGGKSSLRLADYTFALPEGFRLLSTTGSACDAAVAFASRTAPSTSSTGIYTWGSSTAGSSTSAIAAAASADGGCLVMALSVPFTPTPSTPNPYLAGGRRCAAQPAPSAPSTQPSPSTQPGQPGQPSLGCRHMLVGGDTAWLTTAIGSLVGHGVIQLTVALPQPDGQVRDLVVGSSGLSQRTLVDVVSQGLSSSR